MAMAKAIASALVFFFADSPATPVRECMERMVIAVAVAVGKMSFSSLAVWMMKNFRTVHAQLANTPMLPHQGARRYGGGIQGVAKNNP